jgi:predicted murein hydrolase (TIGR00659 family)
MIEIERLYKVWVYLQAEPLFWLTLTIAAYIFGNFIYKKSDLNPLLNPVAISIFIVSFCLITFKVDYQRYFQGAQFIHFMLGPVTVALAVPIYNQLNLIIEEGLSIFITVVVGVIVAITSTYFFSSIFGLSEQMIYTMLPRSVTAPIAMGISEVIGGVPTLTAIITVTTGIIGASIAPFVLDYIKVKDMTARGFAIGLTSHGIGTARAMSKNKKAGVFAALAMSLSGIVTSILIVIIIRYLS